MPLGDARELKKGQFVIALGNPYAIARDGQPSATWGIVANLAAQGAVARERHAAERAGRNAASLWHADPDRRPAGLGTSGGALVNLKGEMVGLTTSLAALAGYEKSRRLCHSGRRRFSPCARHAQNGPAAGVWLSGRRTRGSRRRRAAARTLRARSSRTSFPPRLPPRPDCKSATSSRTSIGKPVADDVDLIRQLSGKPADTTVALASCAAAATRAGRRGGSRGQARQEAAWTVPRQAFAELPIRRLARHARRLRHRRPAVSRAAAAISIRPAACGVIEVERDSPAWKAGLRPGDFVSHVGQARVDHAARILRRRCAETAGDVDTEAHGRRARDKRDRGRCQPRRTSVSLVSGCRRHAGRSSDVAGEPHRALWRPA